MYMYTCTYMHAMGLVQTSNFSSIMKPAIFLCIWIQAGFRFWNQPVLSDEGKFSFIGYNLAPDWYPLSSSQTR